MISKRRLGLPQCLAVIFTLALAAAWGTPDDRMGISWEPPSKPNQASAISWSRTFDAAKAQATRERKPILLLHLFGRLDEEFC